MDGPFPGVLDPMGRNDDKEFTTSLPHAAQPLTWPLNQDDVAFFFQEQEEQPPPFLYELASLEPPGDLKFGTDDFAMANTARPESSIPNHAISPETNAQYDGSNSVPAPQPRRDNQLANQRPYGLHVSTENVQQERTAPLSSPSDISPHTQTNTFAPPVSARYNQHSNIQQRGSFTVPAQVAHPTQWAAAHMQHWGSMPQQFAAGGPTRGQAEQMQHYSVPAQGWAPYGFANTYSANNPSSPTPTYGPYDNNHNCSMPSSHRTSHSSFHRGHDSSMSSVEVWPEQQSPMSPESQQKMTPVTESARRDVFLERNRAAAAKCRQKKKAQDEETQRTRAFQEEHNRQLKEEREGLRGDVLNLKNALLDHIRLGCEKVEAAQELKEHLMTSANRERLTRLLQDWEDTAELRKLRRKLDNSSKKKGSAPRGKRKRSSKTDESDPDEITEEADEVEEEEEAAEEEDDDPDYAT